MSSPEAVVVKRAWRNLERRREQYNVPFFGCFPSCLVSPTLEVGRLPKWLASECAESTQGKLEHDVGHRENAS